MEQEHSALVSSNYEKLPKQNKRTSDSKFDRIYKYYHDSKTKIELTEEEINIRERWEKAWLLLCRQRTQKQVADLIAKMFNISFATAYDDCRNAMMLFSNPQNDLKDAKRAIAESMALKGADRCWKNGDMKGYYQFTEQYKDINKLNADEDNVMAELMKKLKPVQVNIVADIDVLKKMASAIQEELTQDIEHTESDE